MNFAYRGKGKAKSLSPLYLQKHFYSEKEEVYQKLSLKKTP